MAIWNLHMLDLATVGLKKQFGFETLSRAQCDRRTKRLEARPANLLGFEFEGGLKNKGVRSWPSDPGAAWTRVEKSYYEARLNLDRAGAYVRQLPASRLRSRVLAEIEEHAA